MDRELREAFWFSRSNMSMLAKTVYCKTIQNHSKSFLNFQVVEIILFILLQNDSKSLLIVSKQTIASSSWSSEIGLTRTIIYGRP